ncbi:shikimate kinase [Bacteroidia bacterium]|nr:shikimate kinase [Bacteroidia bacterium]
MFSGKTILGKRLAHQLAYDFLDTDKYIETECRCTIMEFFQQHGEAAFRLKERQLLERLKDIDHTVIATGGGLPCYGDAMNWIVSHGVSVYLKADVETLYNRFKNAAAQRPLLNGLSDEAVLQKIQTHLTEREIYYNRATITIDSNYDQLDTLVQRLHEIV